MEITSEHTSNKQSKRFTASVALSSSAKITDPINTKPMQTNAADAALATATISANQQITIAQDDDIEANV